MSEFSTQATVLLGKNKKKTKTYYSADRGAASPAAQNYINELKKIYQGWTAVIMVIECPLQSVVRSHVKVKTSVFAEETLCSVSP